MKEVKFQRVIEKEIIVSNSTRNSLTGIAVKTTYETKIVKKIQTIQVTGHFADKIELMLSEATSVEDFYKAIFNLDEDYNFNNNTWINKTTVDYNNEVIEVPQSLIDICLANKKRIEKETKKEAKRIEKLMSRTEKQLDREIKQASHSVDMQF